MRAYSGDLRRKIVEALDRGMSKAAAARTFGVSRSSVKRHAGAASEGKPLTPKRHPGSQPKLGERARRLLEADEFLERLSEMSRMRLKGSLTGHQKGLLGPFWPPFEEEAEPAVPEWAMAVKELFRGCA